MLDEGLDLLAGGFAQTLGPAEVNGVGLDQIGIELMLADDLAEAVADSGATIVPVGRLRRELLRFASGFERSGRSTDLLNRANPDAVGLAQSAIHGAGFGHAHFGTMDEGRDVGRISVAVADKSSAALRLVNSGLKCPS